MKEISDAEMLAALLPRDASELSPQSAQHPLTVSYQHGPGGAVVPVYVPMAAPQAPAAPSGPLVPSWATGTAVVAVGVGGGAWLLAGAFKVVSMAAAAAAAGVAAALPMLIVAAVAVAAVAGRRGKGGSVEVRQSVTQTVSNVVKVKR